MGKKPLARADTSCPPTTVIISPQHKIDRLISSAIFKIIANNDDDSIIGPPDGFHLRRKRA
jgi:hypothetical protein